MKHAPNIDPASFVVRGKKYRQVAGYPEFCVEATEALCRERPSSFNDVCFMISDMMFDTRNASGKRLFNEKKACRAEVNSVPGFCSLFDRPERYQSDPRDFNAFFGEMRPMHDLTKVPLTEGNHCSWDHYGKKYLRRHFPLHTLGGNSLPVYFTRGHEPRNLRDLLSDLGMIALCLTKLAPLEIPALRKILHPDFSHELAVEPKDGRFVERLCDGSEKPLRMVLSRVTGGYEPSTFENVYLIATRHGEKLEYESLDPMDDDYLEPTAASLAGAEEKHEQRWALLQQNFLKALKVGKHFADATYEEQVEAAASCYWLISHIMPYYRGTSSLARITLQYLAQDVGFTVPFCKQEMDLNLEALTRGHDEFVHHLTSDVLKGTQYFADRRATSQSVMAWHKQRLQPQAATALSL